MGSRRTAGFFGVLTLALLSVSGAALYAAQHPATTPTTHAFAPQAAPAGSFSLITEPQGGIAPVERLIENASSSIDVVMYEFEDAQLEQALAARAKAGTLVRVILDNGYFGAGSSANEQAFDYLQTNGVQVHWSPGYFALTHEKSIVVDGKAALIMSFNFTPQYYKSDRDFGVVDTDADDVAAMERTFDADWNGQNAPAQSGDDLLWSPSSRDQLTSLINSATSSLDIYNEEMQDPQIIAALSQAAQRSVTVEVVMSYSSEWEQAFRSLAQSGVRIRTFSAKAPLYIHAKVIIADGAEAFVGSENFSQTSLDQNRELGLIIADPQVVAALRKTFGEDWQQAAPFLVQ